MNMSMRDLEQIQEYQPSDSWIRRAGVFLLAGASTLGVVYGVGVLMGQRPAESNHVDPLAALGTAAPLVEAARATEDVAGHEPVDPESLDFHAALVGDDRPEVEAAIAAAREEHAALGQLGQMGRFGNGQLGQMVTPTPPAPTSLPAGTLAVGGGETLIDTARRDEMVATALPAVDPVDEEAEAGEEGEDGQFTLQVASFRLEDEAEVFARALRDRGHDSFVVRAEIEGRGVFHRVRVGPFETAGAAGRYRRTFEQEERMDTYVVRNRDFRAES